MKEDEKDKILQKRTLLAVRGKDDKRGAVVVSCDVGAFFVRRRTKRRRD
jgi:hypothetical protein